MKANSRIPAATRSGFTLLELMIAIVIISVLIALLFPAISRIFGRGDEARVVAEIKQLEQALEAFATKYGEYPPSSLTIPIKNGSWSSADRAKVRTIWPEFNFAENGGLQNNGVGANPGEIRLNGAECLIFFLGGLQNRNLTTPVLAGFSKNPSTPWTVSENPDGPFMEFDLSRLADIDGDLTFEYVDPLPEQTTPYLYISAAGKTMNRSNDATPDDYDVFGDFDAFGNGQRDMSFCYMQLDGRNAQRKDAFQIISPGEDGEYGTGGVYGPDLSLTNSDLDGSGEMNPDGSPRYINADRNPGGLTATEFDPLDYVEVRSEEADNITNFASGTLN